jgi:hypothetical protein
MSLSRTALAKPANVDQAGLLGPLPAGFAPLLRCPDHARAAGRRGRANGGAHVAGIQERDGLDVHFIILRDR